VPWARRADVSLSNDSIHAAVVEVERATGLVRGVDYVVVEDCEVLINPSVVDGQFLGGVA